MLVYIVTELKHYDSGDYEVVPHAFSDLAKASEFIEERKIDYMESGYEVMSENDEYIYLEDEDNDCWVQLEISKDEINKSWKEAKNLSIAELDIGEWCINAYKIFYDENKLKEKGFSSIKDYLKKFNNPWDALQEDDVIEDILFDEIIEVSDTDLNHIEIFEEDE